MARQQVMHGPVAPTASKSPSAVAPTAPRHSRRQKLMLWGASALLLAWFIALACLAIWTWRTRPAQLHRGAAVELQSGTH